MDEKIIENNEVMVTEDLTPVIVTETKGNGGKIAVVVALIAAVGTGAFVFIKKRKAKKAKYQALEGKDPEDLDDEFFDDNETEQ